MSDTGLSLDGVYDLRTFFHAVGGSAGQRALNAALPERTESEHVVEMVEGDVACEITCDPLVVAGYVDGIQATLRVCHRGHRPVYLTYVGAGALTLPGEFVGLKEHLFVMCAGADTEWTQQVAGDIPIHILSEESPPDIEREAAKYVSTTRDGYERDIIRDLVRDGVRPLLVDGSLMTRTTNDGLVGVVKTTRTKFLADESGLYALEAGWRSACFMIPSGGESPGVYSCYLRMFDAGTEAWDFGLVRLEAYDLSLLDGLAALCLSSRQSSFSGDGRFDRHLAPVRACEDALRARRPPVFSL